MTKLANIHPDEVLRKEFLKPMQLNQNRIAREMGVPPRRINEICLGKRAITAETAILLGRYFGNSARFWLELQMDYELEEARRHLRAARAATQPQLLEVQRWYLPNAGG